MWDFETLSRKYTSKQLEKLRTHTPKVKACPVCNTTFDAQSYVFRPTAIYPFERHTCSDTCKRIYGGRKNKRIVRDYVCASCNTPFTPHKSKPRQRFCTKLCRGLLLRGSKRPDVQRWVHKLIPPRNSISERGTKWLDELGVPLREHTIVIGNRSYRVDGYDPSTNTVYEYLGSFWHGNPEKHSALDVNPVVQKTFGELYNATIERLNNIRNAGYVVVYTWDSSQ